MKARTVLVRTLTTMGWGGRIAAGGTVAVCASVALQTEGATEVIATTAGFIALAVLVACPPPHITNVIPSDAVRRFIAAVAFVILANVWRTSIDIVVDDRLLPGLWPWLWALACASLAIVVIQPKRLDAWVLSGTAIAAVTTGRMAAVVANAGSASLSEERAAYGLAIYFFILFLTLTTWWLASPLRDHAHSPVDR